jgi:hypothetical protein
MRAVTSSSRTSGAPAQIVSSENTGGELARNRPLLTSFVPGAREEKKFRGRTVTLALALAASSILVLSSGDLAGADMLLEPGSWSGQFGCDLVRDRNGFAIRIAIPD